MAKVDIIGAYNTKFGSFVKRDKETGAVTDLKTIYELMIEAGQGALKDAGINAKDIDGIWVGTCSPSLFNEQEHLGPAALEINPADLKYKPVARVEAACASSTLALHQAVYAVESGRFSRALVIGVEKMNLLDIKGVTHALSCCSYWPTEGAKGMTFPGLFAEYAKGYARQYGISIEDLRKMMASAAALCYKNAVENPLAHFGAGSPPDRMKLFSAANILALPDEKNPVIAEPLHLHDCSLVSDGAAALVIVSRSESASFRSKAVEIAGIGEATERFPLESHANQHELAGGKAAVNKAFSEAGIKTNDLDLAEVHDCFTINQILCTEALGLSRDGRGGYDYIEGKFSRADKCPVNLSGGLKAKGHPVGATGASMHAMIYKQLIGSPIGAKPAKQPHIGVVLNVGGSGVTNCATVLRVN